ncbi:La protein 1 [Sesamum angolense]|uniref:La protein 1 n=1 Tax=Sesamum angolense TaxID=2727404 RepID=A0AAE1W8R7_9LAMI|nr:La protein 1 [Sesamum angolense]
MASATSLDEETAKKVIRQALVVSLALISSFSRMRGHLGLGDVKPEDVSEDTVKAVAETLRNSTFLKVSEDGKKVGRVTELAKPEEVIKQSDERTIAASPLEYDVKIEDVETFFGKYAKVNSVRLPRHVVDNRLFCGTALIEFSSEEDASNILKQTLSYSGVGLELKPKKAFDTERAKQEEEAAKTRTQVGSNRREKANAEPEWVFYQIINSDSLCITVIVVSSDAFDCGSYPKGLIVAFKLKSISAEDSTTQNGNHESVSDDADVSKKDGEQDKTQVNSEETGQDVTDMTTNHVENAGKDEEEEAAKTGAETEAQEPEDAEKSPDNQDDKEDQGSGEGKTNIASYKDNKDVVLREDLKSIFQKFGTVKFIDFKIGSDSGYVRFEDAGAAQKARAAAVLTEEGGLIVKNFIATLDPVTGEAEKEYWGLLRNNQEKYRDNYKSNRGRGGRHNRGGRHLVGSIIAPEKMTLQIAPTKSRKLEQHETVISLLDSTNQFCALNYYLLVDHRLVL